MKKYLICLSIITLLVSACGTVTSVDTPVPPTPIVITVVVSPTSEPSPVPTLTATPDITPTVASPPPTPMVIATPEAIITYPWLNLREGPGSWYPLVAELTQGSRVALLAQYDNCAWLYVRSEDSMIGWVVANPEYLEMSIPCEALPSGAHRPATSIVRTNSRGGGAGEVQINNETPEDGVVVLTWDGYPVYAVYIRSRETFFMSGIADGNYGLWFCHGTDWNGEQFMRQVSYRRFTRRLDFTSDAETYTAWTVTLHGVDGGGTPDTEEIPADTFPQW